MWAIVIKETQREQAKTDQEHVRPTVDEIAQLTFFCFHQVWIHHNYFKHLHVDCD